MAAPFTPMQPDGSLNTARIANYYGLLKRNGVSGAFINGSTGEGVSLTLDEKKNVIDAWAACTKADPDFKVITLVGGTCLRDGITVARHARQSGLYGVALTAPFYFKPTSPAQLARCCVEIAAQVPELAFYYYHIPVLNGVHLPMIDLIRELDGHLDNFTGIKYTHEDFMDFQSCLTYKDGKFDMLWGRDENMLSALVLGARGAVGSTYNYAAPLYHRLINAFEQQDLRTAQALQQKAIDMISLLGKYGGIATGKAYMKLIGLDCGEFRLPVLNMDPTAFSAFEKEVAALQFDEFKST